MSNIETINIINVDECCGCSSCYSICPKSAINMVMDKEGFLYPRIDSKKCIICGKCLKACPIWEARNLKHKAL